MEQALNIPDNPARVNPPELEDATQEDIQAEQEAIAAYFHNIKPNPRHFGDLACEGIAERSDNGFWMFVGEHWEDDATVGKLFKKLIREYIEDCRG